MFSEKDKNNNPVMLNLVDSGKALVCLCWHNIENKQQQEKTHTKQNTTKNKQKTNKQQQPEHNNNNKTNKQHF